MTIGSGTGVVDGTVRCIGIVAAIPVLLCSTGEDIGEAVVQTSVVTISNIVTVRTKCTLLDITGAVTGCGDQRGQILAVELGSQEGHVRSMAAIVVKVTVGIESTVVGADTLWPVLVATIAVTVVTFATLEGRVAGMSVTAVTGGTGIVTVASAAVVVMVHFGAVVTGLADAVEVGIVEVAASCGTIGKVGTDDQHRVSISAHTFTVWLVTDRAGITVGT